jgi:hypothetical protein
MNRDSKEKINKQTEVLYGVPQFHVCLPEKFNMRRDSSVGITLGYGLGD